MEARLITRFVEVAKLHPATSVYVGTRLGIYLLYVYIETHVCKLRGIVRSKALRGI